MEEASAESEKEITLFEQKNVKLKRWKPVKGNETEEVLKIVRRILNKLTPQNYEIMFQQFLQIPIKSKSLLSDIIDLIIQKAADEPVNAKVYAFLCRACLINIVVEGVDKDEIENEFLELLIIKLENQFKNYAKDFEKVLEEKNIGSDSEKESEFDLDNKRRILRSGNIRFIGELFKLNILNHIIMDWYIEQLLQDSKDESLECLCKLFTVIGRLADLPPSVNIAQACFDIYFRRIHNLIRMNDGSNMSSRVRFMLKDVLDFLQYKRKVPRNEDNNSKSLEEIKYEVEREKLQMLLGWTERWARRVFDDWPDYQSNSTNNNTQFEDWNDAVGGGSSSGSHLHKFKQALLDGSRISMKDKSEQQSHQNIEGNSHVTKSLSLNEEMNLKSGKNPWKPSRLVKKAKKPSVDEETERALRNLRGILNKLTPQKFDTLIKQFLKIPINSVERLFGVVNLVYEKAVDEPNSKAYAMMCVVCSRINVNKEVDGKLEKFYFRKILIMKCQIEFEKNKLELLDGDQEVINNCANPEKRKELQLAFEEEERFMRKKSVGNIRFICELFKFGVLTENIMYRCIEQLLQDPQDKSLECLSVLLTTIGRDLEYGPVNQPMKRPNREQLNPYFMTMSNLAQKKYGSKVSPRIRFMLQDVIDLRLKEGVPRREDNNRKIVENQRPSWMNRVNDWPGDRRKRSRSNSGSRGRNFYSKLNKPSVAASRISMMKSDQRDVNMDLRGHSAHRITGAKAADDKPAAKSHKSVFNHNTRKRSEPPAGSINQTASMEKKRMRITQELDSDRPSLQGTSINADGPFSQPPSSFSLSIPRHQDNMDVDSLETKLEKERQPLNGKEKDGNVE